MTTTSGGNQPSSGSASSKGTSADKNNILSSAGQFLSNLQRSVKFQTELTAVGDEVSGRGICITFKLVSGERILPDELPTAWLLRILHVIFPVEFEWLKTSTNQSPHAGILLSLKLSSLQRRGKVKDGVVLRGTASHYRVSNSSY